MLVEGRHADGAIVDHGDFAVRTGGGIRAANTSEQATAAVLEAQAAAARHDQRLHVVGVTWTDDAAAEAALLLESLTEAGFDNVVPIRLVEAAETLARGVAPVVGYDTAAVCLLQGESTTVVMVDGSEDEAKTAVKQLDGGADRLTAWLTAMFDRSTWQPGGVVVVGPDHDLDALSWQLEKALPVPVFTQSGTPLALARGAALASAQNTDFTDAPLVESIDAVTPAPAPARPRGYAGALTMLVAGAVTLVASVSLAIGPRLLPDKPAGPVKQAVHKTAPAPVAKAPTPPPAKVPTSAPHAAPQPEPTQEPTVAAAPAEPQTVVSAEQPVNVPAAEPVPAPPPPAAPPPEPDPHPLLTKLLNRLHGVPDDAAPAPAPPPPNPGAPAP
ncbi:hypothetical protein BST20_14260 [Mycobacterium branderi]|uniref:DUF7159 domain-containing protein n=1 Tax=Mycobacterium branderi TaxID=43348 RepID=A0AA91LXF9_9MYCO|nr:hypothetical protein BST20_14260 [Mycobacterium branderi]